MAGIGGAAVPGRLSPAGMETHPIELFSYKAIAKSVFRKGKPYNPPCPPLKKGVNYKELLSKSPFAKGGFRQRCPVRLLHRSLLVIRCPTIINLQAPFLLREDYFPLTPALSPIGGEGEKWN